MHSSKIYPSAIEPSGCALFLTYPLSVREYEGVPDLYQEILHDSPGISHGKVYQLHTHIVVGESAG